MRVSRIGEFGAIERAAGICKRHGREVAVGIGDDAAAYTAHKDGLQLVTTDMLVEGVHFDLSYTGFRDLGHKALAANLSDIAAMGGRPRYYLISLALPEDFRVEDIEELYRGMEAMASTHGVRAIGGDTCSSVGPVVINITAIGETASKKAVTRAGARPGDDIYVTGTLGDSAGGLELLKAGVSGPEYLISRHLTPTPRVKAGILLAGAGLATSMIDISDGLSSDMGHILALSGVGAVIHKENIPVSDELLSEFGKSRALKFALHGGEDYELLFTARPRARKTIMGLERRARTSFTLIGSVTEGGGALIESAGGKRAVLPPKGYEHFRK